MTIDSKIDLDSLLKALEVAETEKEKDTSKFASKHKPHVKRFIDELGIKTGVERVSTSVVFYTYTRVWKGLTQEKKLKKIEFFRQFKKYFGTTTRTGKQRFYLLDPEAFDLTREGLLEAEHYNKTYNKTKRAKSERKKEKRTLGQSKKG